MSASITPSSRIQVSVSLPIAVLAQMAKKAPTNKKGEPNFSEQAARDLCSLYSVTLNQSKNGKVSTMTAAEKKARAAAAAKKAKAAREAALKAAIAG